MWNTFNPVKAGFSVPSGTLRLGMQLPADFGISKGFVTTAPFRVSICRSISDPFGVAMHKSAWILLTRSCSIAAEANPAGGKTHALSSFRMRSPHSNARACTNIHPGV